MLKGHKPILPKHIKKTLIVPASEAKLIVGGGKWDSIFVSLPKSFAEVLSPKVVVF